MRMKMESRPPVFPAVSAAVWVFMSALVVTDASPSPHPPDSWTTAASGTSLDGKMFTLALDGGDICFYSPYWRPARSASPEVTWQYTTPYYPTPTPPLWSTARPTKGVSVCLRFISDFLQTRSPSLFTLSPSTTPLKLAVSQTVSYSLMYSGYYVQLQPRIRLWPDVRPNMWTSICVTVDSVKRVIQMFEDSSMSIRKLLPYRYVWSGEPVIDFSGFDGQLTDVQVWDYNLSYKDVFYYMSRGSYRPYRGSVVSWSHISYSVRGNALLEETYELQSKRRDKKFHQEQRSQNSWDQQQQ